MTLPLLVEGYNPEWTVDLVSSSGAVFRQDESCTKLLTESGESLVVSNDRLVVEASGQDYGSADVVAIQGTFQREGVPNANKRTYPKGMFERLLGENSQALNCIKSRAMCGHLEHPADGITDLKKIAIIVVECKVQPDGTVWGRAEVLKTTDGLQARALLEGGVRIGISSRGRGTVGAGGVVNDDYILETFDLVYNPSTPGAHPKPLTTSTSQRESVSESAVRSFTSKENTMTFDFAAFEARVRPLIEQDIARLEVYQRGEVSARLIESVQVALAAVKADPSSHVLLTPLIQQMQEKRTALTQSGVNEAKVLEERVEELSSALTEAQEAAAEQKEIADAGVALSEALVEEFKAKLAEIDESESEEDAEESDEDVEIEESDEESDAEALREALSVLKAKYDAACQIIEELTKSEEAPKADPVKESIDAAVTKHPFLAESRALLERETSVEQVAVVAEALIKMAVKAGAKIEESKVVEGTEKPETKPETKVEESSDASRPKGKTVESDGASSTATLTESATAKPTSRRGSLISEMSRLGKFA